jgi:small-conductance mechanosensitive channel
MMDVVTDRILDLSNIEYFTFAFNIFVYLFSNSIVSHHRDIDEDTIRSRTKLLHGFNLLVFVSFIASLVFRGDEFPADEVSRTSLTLLASYLIFNGIEAFLLSRYGEEIEVMGVSRKVETPTSRTLELVAFSVIVMTVTIGLINVWGITGLLETTGVIGFLALIVFTTKDYWLRDFLSGILVIGGNSAKRGDVISIPEVGILGIILEIRGLQTRIRDLAQGHDIEIPNYNLLQYRTDYLRKSKGGPFKDFVEFNIGYGIPSETVKSYLSTVYNTVSETSPSLDSLREPKITIRENSNNAVIWRLTYVLERPYQLLLVRNSINLAAYDLQDEFGIQLSTPQLEKLVEP